MKQNSGDKQALVGNCRRLGLNLSPHKNAGSKREIRVDGYLFKTEPRMERRRIAANSSLGKIIAAGYP